MRADLEKLRLIVLRDLKLQTKLREIDDRELFVDTVIDVGRQYGLDIGREDVDDAMQENRRAWVERWI